MKLVILGGGGFRTPYVWQALIRDQGSPRVTEVALYDVDESRLATITAIGAMPLSAIHAAACWGRPTRDMKIFISSAPSRIR